VDDSINRAAFSRPTFERAPKYPPSTKRSRSGRRPLAQPRLFHRQMVCTDRPVSKATSLISAVVPIAALSFISR
jgi:hypothetical protein